MNPALKSAVGRRIEIVRKDMGLSKVKFAALIGITNQSLGAIERGESGCSCETIFQICNKTGVSADYIFFGRMGNPPFVSPFNDIFTYNNIKHVDSAIDSLQELKRRLKPGADAAGQGSHIAPQ